MRRLGPRVRAAIATILAIWMSLVMGGSVVLAAPPQNGPCRDSQINDNSWIVRDSTPIATSPNWLVYVQADITPYNYALCTFGTYAPLATGSGAWVAITPNQAGASIIQIGYWKCGSGIACGNGMKLGELDYFYAWGVEGDIFHQPWPTYISGPVAISGTHTFKVHLYYPGDGTREWRLSIDGVVKKYMNDDWRTWPRQRAQIGVENWNCGDQLGGRNASGSDAGNKQKFRNVTWRTNVTHNGDMGVVYRPGHFYPWGYFDQINDSDFDVWTSAHTTNICA